ncbi:tubulin-specific chaperone, putative [Plasmodium knowlesi strain H]|uniref:Tubulin-specific chaperone, putative n=3 Tax=Plasmodium knowlesi TaxID=5850 RepID=A0A1A7VSF2_PLAKH|nr:tubulin-specific chaperone, putative [Plasmodium knowlesi strain H]OTN67262.1 putative Tubulin-specific chaperone [Plasmodium knowlesi]CAA9987337.1 tubulin-specific chaperone, putative [Plasmodium knowlesi strain H]SBO23380.1 tubulin-specific chaperone, putative [Plasmodium knowlesi strain H]SBO24597.1 tubulin-specific chaperone, putative [Plasmodium knowlesi strain H]VVS76811.1 tubulin-specific chaperone, putative [Plasmodium knowlesi strain H]
MSDFVKVDLVHNLYKNKKWKEIKLNKFESIENVKKKIYTHTGTPHNSMELYAYDELNIENSQVHLSNDNFCLNDYHVKDNYTIYIQDKSNIVPNDIIYHIDDADRLNQLKHFKYEMKEEDYDKRQDTFRNFIKKLRARGGGAPQVEATNSENYPNGDIHTNGETLHQNPPYDEQTYQIGNRCRIKIGDRRGVLKFVGKLKKGNEISVGVDLDEPLGNSDGTYQNKFLFECKGSKYGYLGNINSIEVGDYPPFDIMDLDEF